MSEHDDLEQGEVRRFSTKKTGAKPLRPFDLDGVGVMSGEEWSERFHCVPDIPPAAWDDLASSVGTDRRGRQVYNHVSLLRFFNQVLVDDDVERFNDLMADKDKAVEIEVLGEIMEWLTEAESGVPTQRRPASTNGAGRAAST